MDPVEPLPPSPLDRYEAEAPAVANPDPERLLEQELSDSPGEPRTAAESPALTYFRDRDSAPDGMRSGASLSNQLGALFTPELVRRLSRGERIPVTGGAQRAVVSQTAGGFRIEGFTQNARNPTSAAEFFVGAEGELVGTGDFSKIVSDALAKLGDLKPQIWYIRDARDLEHLDASVNREIKRYYRQTRGGKQLARYQPNKIVFANEELLRQHERYCDHFFGHHKASRVAERWDGRDLRRRLFDRKLIASADIELDSGVKLSAARPAPVTTQAHADRARSFIDPDAVLARKIIGNAAAGSEAALPSSSLVELRSADGTVHMLGYELGPEVFHNVDTYMISHAHGDHLDLRALRRRLYDLKQDTTIVCTKEVQRDILDKLGAEPPKNLTFKTELQIGDYLVEARPNPLSGHGPDVGRTAVTNTTSGERIALLSGDGDFALSSIDRRIREMTEELEALGIERAAAEPGAEVRVRQEELSRLKALREDLRADWRMVEVDTGTSGFDSHGSARTVDELRAAALEEGAAGPLPTEELLRYAEAGDEAGFRQALRDTLPPEEIDAKWRDVRRYRKTHNLGYAEEVALPNPAEGAELQLTRRGATRSTLLRYQSDLREAGFNLLTPDEASRLQASQRGAQVLELEFGNGEVHFVRTSRFALRRWLSLYSLRGSAPQNPMLEAGRLKINGQPAVAFIQESVRSTAPAAGGRLAGIDSQEAQYVEAMEWLESPQGIAWLKQNPKIVGIVNGGAKALRIAGPVLLVVLAAKEIHDNWDGLKKGEQEAVTNLADFLLLIPESFLTGIPDILFTGAVFGTNVVINLGHLRQAWDKTASLAFPLSRAWSYLNRAALGALPYPGAKDPT